MPLKRSIPELISTVLIRVLEVAFHLAPQMRGMLTKMIPLTKEETRQIDDLLKGVQLEGDD